MEIKCKHHWVFEEPNGEVSKGVCKICRAETVSFNVFFGDRKDLNWTEFNKMELLKTARIRKARKLRDNRP